MPLKRTALKPGRKPGSQEPEKRTGPAAAQPGLESDEEQAEEPGRPYQVFVESEARKYWAEIAKTHNLTKPPKSDFTRMHVPRMDAMFRASARNLYASAEVAGMQPWSNPAVSEAMDTERSHQAFDENEARKYWQETAEEHNLTKPTLEEIRAAAMPILCRALRNRTGSRRHRAVAGMVQHAGERGWISRFHSGAHESPSYIGALIQLADDANWLAREIPLPDHPPPRHPPIYYTIDYVKGRPVPVPREDAIIRGDYLYKEDGSRLTEEKEIHPVSPLPGSVSRLAWRFLDGLIEKPGLSEIHQDLLDNSSPVYYGLTLERARKPANRRGVYVWFDWKAESGEESPYFSSQLRDYPYPSGLIFSPHPPRDLRD